MLEIIALCILIATVLIISPIAGVLLSYQHVTRHVTFTTVFMVHLIPSKSRDRNDGSVY